MLDMSACLRWSCRRVFMVMKACLCWSWCRVCAGHDGVFVLVMTACLCWS